VDAFALQLDPDRPGYFDNDPSQSHTTLWGLYATIPLTTKSTAARFNNIALDLFYLGFYHGNARFNDGVGNETRHTLGGGYGELTISTDWILIFLEFTNSGLSAARRSAHFLSRSIWVTSCRNCPGRVESPVASRSPVGDSNPNDKRLETFNAMFPAGYYYGGGLIGQVGPANAIILQPELDLHPTTTLGIYLKALFVWREDTADGLYNTPGNLIRVGSTNNKRYVGASPEILVTQELGRHAILPSLLPFLPGRLPDREPADFKGCRLFFHLADV